MTGNDLNFEYHPSAVEEATEAFNWYAAHSPQAAERFWEELVQARLAAASGPELWPPYFHGTRCVRFSRFPYGLVYIQMDQTVIGLAVVHFRRRPGYWKDRLSNQLPIGSNSPRRNS